MFLVSKNMIIATTNSKGGVGKSTIAVHLAAWLHQQGKNVIVIDCDTQQSCSRWLHRVNVEIGYATYEARYQRRFGLRDSSLSLPERSIQESTILLSL